MADNDQTNRRLAAILAADVVGYSRMMGADEAGTLAALKHHREAVFDPAVAQYKGRVVKLIGDGTLVEFASVVDAVKCALAVQRAAKTMAEPNGKGIVLRIGINLGDVIIDGDDIYGDGVNVAARLESLAEPGGLCVSAIVHESLGNRIDVAFQDGGEVAVKNIRHPIRIWKWHPESEPVIAKSAAVETAQPLPDKPSIAVLAFTNMSGDPEQEYFSDGISEDIITDLSKVSELDVIARNSTFTYKGKPVNVKQVGRELGVRYVLEGSVRKVGNRVRVTGQLIDATTGAHIWADRFDRDLTDIFAVQDELTQEIISALKISLSEREKALIVSGGTKSVEAHDLFLRGRELIMGNRNQEIFVQSTTCFERAIELDPTYAAPYAGLGMAFMLDYQNHWSDTPEKSLDKAERFVRESIARDDKDPFAHYVAALISMWQKNHNRWTEEADKALSLNPNYAQALTARGTVPLYSGEPVKAIPYFEQAIRLDPAQSQHRHFLGTAYFIAGKYETAAAVFKERIAMTPTTDFTRAFLASTLGHLGQVDEARTIWNELMAINPRYSYADHIGRQPFRDPAVAERFTEGLRKAGLAE
jgi:adenylate cyclase